MLPLTKKELKFYQEATECYICGKRFLKKFTNDKNYRKDRDCCHYALLICPMKSLFKL